MYMTESVAKKLVSVYSEKNLSQIYRFESRPRRWQTGESLPALQHDTVLPVIGIEATELIRIFDYVK